MPFLKGGRLAITRTSKYLNSGQIILGDSVKIIAINHVPNSDISRGCDDFIKWFLPPLQFKNPKVQIITLKNMCPTPFIKAYLTNDKEVVVDCSYREHTDIHKHLIKLFGENKTAKVIDHLTNPANFGDEYHRQCICVVYGQVPCSSQCGKPKPWPNLEPSLPVVPEAQSG